MSEALMQFRKLVHDGIRRALELDGVHKGYEGHIALRVDLPSFFDDKAHTLYSLTLDCYVLGPGRHYVWHAVNERELFEVATRDVTSWIARLSDDEPEPPKAA